MLPSESHECWKSRKRCLAISVNFKHVNSCVIFFLLVWWDWLVTSLKSSQVFLLCPHYNRRDSRGPIAVFRTCTLGTNLMVYLYMKQWSGVDRSWHSNSLHPRRRNNLDDHIYASGTRDINHPQPKNLRAMIILVHADSQSESMYKQAGHERVRARMYVCHACMVVVVPWNLSLTFSTCVRMYRPVQISHNVDDGLTVTGTGIASSLFSRTMSADGVTVPTAPAKHGDKFIPYFM